MKKRYQKILGVSDSFSPEELKKAFRKKANEFHPDKNPSKDAQKQFIEICEAYKALLENNFKEEESINVAEQNLRNKKYHKDLSPEEFEERLRKAREYAKIKTFKEENIRELSFYQIQNTSITKLHWWTCVFSAIIIVINSFDYLVIPPVEIEGQIVAQHLEGVYMEYKILDFEATKQHEIDHPMDPYHFQYINFKSKIDNDSWNYIHNGLHVTVYKTYLFDDLLGLSKSELGREDMNTNYQRFHLLFWVYIGLFIFPLIVACTKGANSFYIITVYLSTYLSSVIGFFYLINLFTHLNA